MSIACLREFSLSKTLYQNDNDDKSIPSQYQTLIHFSRALQWYREGGRNNTQKYGKSALELLLKQGLEQNVKLHTIKEAIKLRHSFAFAFILLML